MARLSVAAVAAALVAGCAPTTDAAPEGDTVRARTEAELTAILDALVAATGMPETRRITPDEDVRVPCGDGEHRLTAVVLADDPPELEPLADRIQAYLETEGWQLAALQPSDGPGGRGESRFLQRDGFETIVDVVRGTQGTGVDVEVLAPCRDLDG